MRPIEGLRDGVAREERVPSKKRSIPRVWRVALAAAVLLALPWLCFRSTVGLRAAVAVGLAGQTGLSVAWLRATEAVSRGTPTCWKAYTSEIWLLEWDARAHSCGPSAASDAVERYLHAAEAHGTPPWVADAYWRKARLAADSGAWAEASDVLERGVRDHWADPWSSRYWPDRVRWMTRSGRAPDAVRLLDAFGQQHGDSGSEESFIDAVWSAYWSMGETEAGAQRLREAAAAHPGTRLAQAITRLLDGISAEPGRGKTVTPS